MERTLWSDQRIDDSFGQLRDEMREFRIEMREMRAEMNAEFRNVRGEMAGIRRDMFNGMVALVVALISIFTTLLIHLS